MLCFQFTLLKYISISVTCDDVLITILEVTYLPFPTALTEVIVSDHRARDARKGGRLTGDHLARFFMYAGSEYETISRSRTSMKSLSKEDEDG